jgi:hypothetical protein
MRNGPLKLPVDQLEKALRLRGAARPAFTENPQPMWIFDARSSRFLAANNAALRQYGFTPEEFSALIVRGPLPGTSVASSFNTLLNPARESARAIGNISRKMDVD